MFSKTQLTVLALCIKPGASPPGWGTPAPLGFTPGTHMHGQVSIRTSSADFPLKLSHPSFLLFFRAVR